LVKNNNDKKNKTLDKSEVVVKQYSMFKSTSQRFLSLFLILALSSNWVVLPVNSITFPPSNHPLNQDNNTTTPIKYLMVVF
jgi:hypothetical protein